MHELEGRVRSLERRQRQLAIVCGALAIVLVGSILWPLVRVPREVSARRFVLKDSEGGTRGRWGLRDRTAGEIDDVTQYASSTCLEIHAARKTDGMARLCVPWDGEGGPHLAMVEKTGASLDVGVDAYAVSLLVRTSRGPANRGSLVLGVWQDEPSVQVSDKQGRRTQIRAEGLQSYDAVNASPR